MIEATRIEATRTQAPRLLHVFPGFGPGGTQLRMVSIINSLGGRFAHRVISLDGNTEAARAFAGVDVTVEGPPASSKTPRPLVFRAIIREMHPDAVLTYNWGAIEATLGARLAGVCPVIHNECGFGADEAQRLIQRRVWTRRLVLNSIFRTAVTSETMLKIARRDFKLSRRKVQLIRTGVDVARYCPRSNDAGREVFGDREGAVVFGYLGGLRPEKNLSMLIRSYHAADLPNSRLVLIGEGPCRGDLEGLAQELKIADRVIFAGHRPEPSDHLAGLDVFVMSSITEQVSNAQLEAMASGLPVICTNAGDSRELLGQHAESCVVEPNDEAAYTDTLRRIAGDRNLRLSLGSANRDRAVRLYSKERMVEEYAGLFEAALAQRRHRQRLGQDLKESNESCTRLESGT
jgi:glycosyltransferase involved in cell wall biosynthesis